MKYNLQKILLFVLVTFLVSFELCFAAESNIDKGFSETKVVSIPENLLGIIPSLDMKEIAIAIQEDNKQYLIIDGKDGPKNEQIIPTSIIFDPNNNLVVYILLLCV